MKKNQKTYLVRLAAIAVGLMLVIGSNAQAQVPAFPGAEGLWHVHHWRAWR